MTKSTLSWRVAIVSLALAGGLAATRTISAARADQALIRAILQRNSRGVRVALARGADPNARLSCLRQFSLRGILDSLFHRRTTPSPTALLVAMGWHDESRPSILPVPEDVDVVRVLVGHGAAINVRDKNGDTALTLSAWAPGTSNDGVFDYLVDHGADISAKDDFEQDAWCRSGFDEHRMAVLLARGQDVNERDSLGETLLFHVILASNPESVRFLLNHGSSVNVRDHDGASPLSYARRFRDMLAAGQGGRRPAVIRSCADVIQILMNAGAHD